MSDERRGGGAWPALLLALVAFAAGLLVRLANFGLVLNAGGVRFPSGRDELYHVRRIVYQALRFPERLDFDPYVSFPFGARPVWPPYLDQGLGALAHFLVPGGDAAAIEYVIVWLPPLLGALTVVVVAELGRRHGSWLAGLAAGLLLALMPAHQVHSQLGQVDHQVWVGLGIVLLLACTMGLVTAASDSRRTLLAVAGGVLAAACLLVTPGALPQVLPVQAVLVGFALGATQPGAACTRARLAALFHATAALLLAPACLGNGGFPGIGELSPLVLSNFQPLWFGGGAVLLFVLAQLWQRVPALAMRGARVGSAAALAVLASLAALAVSPALRAALAQAGGWFTHEDPFLKTVAELRPLLFPRDGFDPKPALSSLTNALPLLPFAWLALAVRWARAPGRRPEDAVVLAFTAATGVLALAQERFANLLAPAFALLLALALAALREAARSRARPRTRWLLDAVIVALALAALVPPALMVRQLLAVSRLAREHPRWVPPGTRDKAVVEEAARWLKGATPPTRGFLDASLRPEYGVLTPWDYGHLVRYLAERPTVQDNFGSFGDRRAFVLAGRYFEAMDEEVAYEAAREAGARYAVVTVSGSGQVVQPSPNSVGRLLWRWLGAAAPGSPAFGRHRLVWVEDAPGRPQPREIPTLDRVAVFELVAGALVVGEAPPGARVEAELRLRCGSGHLRYAAVTKAGDDGRYTLRLPYATNLPASPAVSAVGEYRLRTGRRSAALAVPDADVRAGANIAGPNLR